MVSAALGLTRWDVGEEAAESPPKPSPEPASLLGASLQVACAREIGSKSFGADPVWGDGMLAGTKPSDG